MLEYQLNSEKERTKFSTDVALGLVRNTNYRSFVFDSEMKDGYYNEKNEYIPPTNVTKTYNKDKNWQIKINEVVKH